MALSHCAAGGVSTVCLLCLWASKGKVPWCFARNQDGGYANLEWRAQDNITKEATALWGRWEKVWRCRFYLFSTKQNGRRVDLLRRSFTKQWKFITAGPGYFAKYKDGNTKTIRRTNYAHNLLIAHVCQPNGLGASLVLLTYDIKVLCGVLISLTSPVLSQKQRKGKGLFTKKLITQKTSKASFNVNGLSLFRITIGFMRGNKRCFSSTRRHWQRRTGGCGAVYF